MSKAMENRAPLCATCKYVRRYEITWYVAVESVYEPWWKFWGRSFDDATAEPKTEVREEWFCSIARDCVTGRDKHYALAGHSDAHNFCAEERSDPLGCGPGGRNWVANPDWLRALKDSGESIHPDLEAMIEAAHG